METIIKQVRGDSLSITGKTCQFCSKSAVASFGVIKDKKYDGEQLNHFGICEEHFYKLNSLLSGEFDIDMIALDRYLIKKGNSIHLRGAPPLPISKIAGKSWKCCRFPGCTNRFYGIFNKDYCDDPRCKEERTDYFKSIKRPKYKDPNVKNLVLTKKHKDHIHSDQVLKLRCRARDGKGARCNETFVIRFDARQHTYPAFCEAHRSYYKRQRFALEGKDAKNQPN